MMGVCLFNEMLKESQSKVNPPYLHGYGSIQNDHGSHPNRLKRLGRYGSKTPIPGL
jgi:hypothetical protein